MCSSSQLVASLLFSNQRSDFQQTLQRGERVLVLMSAGDKRHEHVGYVSNVFGDKIIVS
jgi:hypothetical protein